MATLTFKNINKVYDNNVQAVFDFNLDVKDREFIVFVGPSGCGKSTTLRMVAGLEEISSGELFIGYDSAPVDVDYCASNLDQEKVAFCYQVKVDEKGLTTGSDLVPYKKADEPIVFINDRSEITYELKTQYSKSFFNRLSVTFEYETSDDVLLNVCVADNPFFSGDNKYIKSFNLVKGNEEQTLVLDDFVSANRYSSLFVKLVWPFAIGEKLHIKSLRVDDNEQRIINDVEPKNRDIAMVFQSYALYPHMTVYNNIAFGLRLRHVSKEIIDERVVEVAETLGLTPYLKRKPSALSGGQRQRVALGRAIVRSPKVFLMDEPLSNLDAKLRVTMRSEIAKIHEKVGATTIYVTHDQTEAMTMATRIVVMKDGFIQQIGTPREVYSFPENVFVGSFIGSPAMNFIECEFDTNKEVVNVVSKGEVKYSYKPTKEQIAGLKDYLTNKPIEIQNDMDTLSGLIEHETNEKILELMNKDMDEFRKDFNYYQSLSRSNNVSLLLGIRPENIYLIDDPRNTNKSAPFDVEADVTELLGHEFIVYGYLGDSRIVIKLGGGSDVKQHTVRTYAFDLSLSHFFDPHNSKRIKLEKKEEQNSDKKEPVKPEPKQEKPAPKKVATQKKPAVKDKKVAKAHK